MFLKVIQIFICFKISYDKNVKIVVDLAIKSKFYQYFVIVGVLLTVFSFFEVLQIVQCTKTNNSGLHFMILRSALIVYGKRTV